MKHNCTQASGVVDFSCIKNIYPLTLNGRGYVFFITRKKLCIGLGFFLLLEKLIKSGACGNKREKHSWVEIFDYLCYVKKMFQVINDILKCFIIQTFQILQ